MAVARAAARGRGFKSRREIDQSLRYSVTLTHFVASKDRPTADSEYMLQKPDVAGSNLASAIATNRRAAL